MLSHKPLLVALLFVGVCLGIGMAGGLLTKPAIEGWYALLVKPSFTPPSWLFGPVWTALYIMMGIAAFLVWQTRAYTIGATAALTWFTVQLALNALWTPLFFGLRAPLAGLIDIILMLIAIVITTIKFSGISPAAGMLMLPYLAWVSFATILNASIVWLNR